MSGRVEQGDGSPWPRAHSPAVSKCWDCACERVVGACMGPDTSEGHPATTLPCCTHCHLWAAATTTPPPLCQCDPTHHHTYTHHPTAPRCSPLGRLSHVSATSQGRPPPTPSFPPPPPTHPSHNTRTPTLAALRCAALFTFGQAFLRLRHQPAVVKVGRQQVHCTHQEVDGGQVHPAVLPQPPVLHLNQGGQREGWVRWGWGSAR